MRQTPRWHPARWLVFLQPHHLTRWRIFLLAFVLAHVVIAAFTSLLAAASLAIVEAAVLAWVFVIAYARVPGWYASRAGVQMMSLGLFVALLTSVSLIPQSLSEPWIDYAALVILVGMAAIMLNLCRLLWLARRSEGGRP